MKAYIITIIAIFISISAFAQDTIVVTPKQSSEASNCDYILFKNGDELNARVIEITPKEIRYRKCDNINGPLYVGFVSDVFLIRYANGTKEVLADTTIKTKRRHTYTKYKSGYTGSIDLGYATTINDYNFEFTKLDVLNGARIGQGFTFSLGTGLRFFKQNVTLSSYEDLWLPIYLNLKFDIFRSKSGPYISFGLGETYNLGEGMNDIGIWFNSTVGVSFKLSEKVDFHIGLSYESQSFKLENPNYNYLIYSNTSYSGLLRSFDFHMGISF